jgi:hypothetical protein
VSSEQPKDEKRGIPPRLAWVVARLMQLEEEGFRGCYEIHFPGKTGNLKGTLHESEDPPRVRPGMEEP